MHLFIDPARVAKADRYQEATARVLGMLDNLQENAMAMVAPITDAEQITPPSGQWQLLHMQMRMWTRVGIHSSLLLTNPEGRSYLEFHALVDPDSATGERLLRMHIEPHDYDCCDMPRHEPDVAWSGDEMQAAEKAYRLCHYTGQLNQSREPYRLLSNNCNTAVKEMLIAVGIDGPLRPRGYMPGITQAQAFGTLEATALPSPARLLEIFRAMPAALTQELGDCKRESAPWLMPRLSARLRRSGPTQS